jgi:hypothetical protein
MCVICNCNGDYSSLEGLQILNCGGCTNLTSIPVIDGLQTLDYMYCKYIHPTNHHIDYIRILQQRIKRVILYKKLKRMVTCRPFVELWYHPESKGGYFIKQKAIKGMEDALSDVF